MERQKRRDTVKQANHAEDYTFVFKISDCQVHGLQQKELLVTTGVTSHVITDVKKL